MEAVGQQAVPSRDAAAGPVPKLRLGLFASSLRQPRWIVEALARLAQSDFAEVVVIGIDDSGSAPPPWLWRIYDFADRHVFHSCSDRLGLADTVRHQRMMSFRQCDVSWLEQVAAMRLDVAFALDDFDDYALQRLARFGCWRYFFGEERGERDGWAGFREVLSGHAVTTSGIKVRCGGVERIAYQSWSRTYPFSASRNRDLLLRKSAEFAGRSLRDLHRGGEAWLLGRTRASRQAVAPTAPALPEIARGLAGLAGRIARRAAQKLALVDQWCLAYRFDAPEQWHADLGAFQTLMPPEDRFWADPFVLERDGRHYIFFEELLFSTGKGHISVIEVDRDGRHSQPVKVLERDYHLSYPFMIEEGGELFMVPETGQNRTVEIYRCVDFPNRWELEKVLLRDVWAVDATFLKHAGKWWMFVNIGIEGTEIYDELHLYHADRLLGNWTPHALNPIKSDARNARPAGRLYVVDGALHRPAQICTPLYGSGIALNRITELSADRYAETEVRRVLPASGSGLLGIHTYNRVGALTVIDGFLRSRRRGVPEAMRKGANAMVTALGRRLVTARMRSSTP